MPMANGLLPFNLNKSVRIITWSMMGVMLVYGIMVVAARLIPFGVDEWRLIYNIKFKNAAELLGPLDFVQQFPRTYLEVIKSFSGAFDYSYFSLRLLPFTAGAGCILFSYRLMQKMYKEDQPSRYLFVLLLIGSPAFFEYIIQVKQYTMDILLSLVALRQLLALHDIATGKKQDTGAYLLLCISFLAAPFLSYTYSIVVVPVIGVAMLHCVQLVRNNTAGLKPVLLRMWLPIVCLLVAIGVFYKLDAAQLLKDDKMHFYWRYMMMQDGFDIVLLGKALYNLFALGGSGLVFEIIAGGMSIVGIGIALAHCIGSLRKKEWLAEDYVMWYSAGLVALVLVLFTLGKLPIGERRLNSFILPVTGVLIIGVIGRMKQAVALSKWGEGLVVLLVLASVGSVVSSPVNELTSDKRRNTLLIYEHTEKAIEIATAKHLPLFITPGIASPYQQIINYPHTNVVATELCVLPGSRDAACGSLGDNIPGDWILKTFPAYKVTSHLPVYAIGAMADVPACMQQLPPGVTSVMAGDGINFSEVKR